MATTGRKWTKIFKVDVRDPYMGNTIPLRIIVGETNGRLSLVVVNGEGIHHTATEEQVND